ncbi:phosphoribosyl 1,2-cyclic phosphodiesterase [Devosia insulae DS-56]|uniref:Phosphoribosyl 1,2-cyclic phosphodiesterase n=1 Tax=Devosia insulae DS-56 TaxID=1116389 RepID=A0A1E5XLB5_9HYPH|nr:MBL fold metallo-hydrolase [Devosia insulae]OEO29396.1 phosphoribosyl 1,2-cyclic phosphodiesterase [Devosia insulae DS-56]
MPEAQRIVATIMGCGSSGGVPRIGGHWGVCDPNNPKNRRSRCSLLIEGFSAGSDEPTRIIVDTGCDLREQLLRAEVDRVEAVLYTHEHADHTHGIDDLRVLALINRKRVDVYFTAEAANRIVPSFAYCFTAPPGSGYPPILNQHLIEAGTPLTVDGPGGSITVLPFRQDHGDIFSLGFRVRSFAYSCDLSGIPEVSREAVSELDTWVLDALRPTPHPSHLSLSEALELVEDLKPRHAVLTNLHIDLDYAQTDAMTPDHVRPAFDGLQIDITAGEIISPR